MQPKASEQQRARSAAQQQSAAPPKNTTQPELQNNRALVVVSHPDAESLTVAAARMAHERARDAGMQCRFVHLDALGYNPVMPRDELRRKRSFDEATLEFQHELEDASRAAFFFPDWWGMPPAPLAGWLQRVFAAGVAFSAREDGAGGSFSISPRLGALRVLFALSSDTEDEAEVLLLPARIAERLSRIAGSVDAHVCALAGARAKPHGAKTRWMAKCADIFTARPWQGGNTVF